MIASNLPALQVVIPLIAAPLCALLRSGENAWRIALVANWAAFAVAIGLGVEVAQVGTISYMLGGWEAPLGIEYRVDAINVFVLLVITSIGAVILPYASTSVAAATSYALRLQSPHTTATGAASGASAPAPCHSEKAQW